MTTEPVDGELKYLAGLFEGEGSSSIGKGKHPKSRIGYQYQGHLVVRMTDNEPIHALHDYFGGSTHVVKQHEDINYRAVYVWSVHGRDTSRVAKLLMPHILIPRKRGALQCMIDFAATITSGTRPLSPELLQRREDLYQKCRAYNARGISANNRDEDALEEIEVYKTKTAQMDIWA